MKKNKEIEPIAVWAYPFQEGIEFNKSQFVKILEEASEFYSATMSLVGHLSNHDKFIETNSEEEYEEMRNIFADSFVEEAGDIIQTVVNTIYLLTGKDKEATQSAISIGMNIVINKNNALNYYGEIGESEETDERESGNDAEA